MHSVRKERAGAARPEPGLYEADDYTWTLEQAAALRAGRLTALDADHLAEEIEDLGRETFKELESAYRLILIHMLKWDHQPERRSRSWAGTIQTQRLDATYVLRDNPGLQSRRGDALERAWRKARIKAAVEMKRAEATLPANNPYSLDEMIERPFVWLED